MPQIESIDIPASHGFLDALLRIPDMIAPPHMAAVVCHPHPQGGGTMHNKVVFTMAKALNEAGVPALRFNYRGVGRSTGHYDFGRGESDDIRTAIAYMAQRYPLAPLVVSGFSFGSWLGLPIGCADARVTHVIGVGVPVQTLDIAHLADCTKSKLIVQGTQDEYGPVDILQAWFAGIAEPKQLTLIDGATHFFPTTLDKLGTAISTWLTES